MNFDSSYLLNTALKLLVKAFPISKMLLRQLFTNLQYALMIETVGDDQYLKIDDIANYDNITTLELEHINAADSTVGNRYYVNISRDLYQEYIEFLGAKFLGTDRDQRAECQKRDG